MTIWGQSLSLYCYVLLLVIIVCTSLRGFEVDTRKNTVVQCATLCIKKFILNSSNLISKLEDKRVKVESIERKVKLLKSGDIFLYF